MFIFAIQRIFIETVWGVIWFPLWWYTLGLKHIGRVCASIWREGNAILAPGLWLKYIFVPMFGQYDWQGRLVSFFVRLLNLIFRTLGLFIWSLVVILLLLGWLILPFGIILALARSL